MGKRRAAPKQTVESELMEGHKNASGDLRKRAAPKDKAVRPSKRKREEIVLDDEHTEVQGSSVAEDAIPIPPVHTGRPVINFLNSDNESIQPLQSICGSIHSHLSTCIIEKIWQGEYVDFAILINKNNNEVKNQLNLTLSHDGNICVVPQKEKLKFLTFELWSDAFLIFMFVYIEKHPEKAGELILYLNMIRKMNARYGWAAAKTYDENFRYRLAKNPTRSWSVIDGELFMFNCLPPSSNQNHAKPNNNVNAQKGRNVCYAYNRGNCSANNCKYDHRCSKCGHQNHPSVKCKVPFRGSQGGGSQGGPK